MCGRRVDRRHASLSQRRSGVYDRRRGVDLVIDDDGPPAIDLSDHVEHLTILIVRRPAFLYDGERCVETLREVARPLRGADVSSHHDQVFDALLFEVSADEIEGRQLIDGDVEEALDLAGVQVHGEQTVRARGLDQVREQPGRDRHTGLIFLIAPAIGVVRHDGGHAPCRCPLHGIDHDQKLHDAGVDRRRQRLDQEDVSFPHVLLDLDEDVLIAEGGDLAGAPGRFQVRADRLRQLRVRVATEDHKFFVG